ncbi:MAG: cell division FtsA domain-containing protein [Christensenellales bacterium]|jgi:cell division protein FtsA
MAKLTTIMEFGMSKIVCFSGRMSKKGDAVEMVAGASVDWQGEGQPFEDSAFLNALKKTVDELNRKVRPVKKLSVAIPGSYTSIALSSAAIPIPEDVRAVTEAHVDDFIYSAENFKVPDGYETLHRCPVTYQIDQRKVLDPVGKKGSVLTGEVSFVFAQKELLQRISACFAELRIEVEQFIASPLAQGLSVIPAFTRDEIAVLVDCGYRTTDISIFQGDGMIYHGVVEMGSYDMIRAIASTLQAPMSQAEQLKRQYVYGLDTMPGMDVIARNEQGRGIRYPLQKVQEAMESNLIELLNIIKKVVYNGKTDCTEKTKIFFGGGAFVLNRGSREFVQKIFTNPFEYIELELPYYSLPNFAGAYGTLDFAVHTTL